MSFIYTGLITQREINIMLTGDEGSCKGCTNEDVEECKRCLIAKGILKEE